MGAKNEEIEKITNAFIDQGIAIKETNKRLSNTQKMSEHIYKEYYENLDTLRKADFVKVVKKMEDEVAAAKKKHKDLGTEEELGADVIAAIRTRIGG